VHKLAGQFRSQENEADLGSVAVSYDHFPALFHHAGYVSASLSRGPKLVSHCLMVFVYNQGISADGHDCCFPQSSFLQDSGDKL
jgi:hypothetical protein